MKRTLGILVVFAAALTSSGQFKQFSDVPAYNAEAPARGQTLPAIWTEAQLLASNNAMPAQIASYKAAARVPNVLHQLPCYCFCDRSFGHNSLHSCFEGVHGAHCSTCMKEALFAEQQTRLGKSPKHIRELIMRGEHDKIDLSKVTPASVPSGKSKAGF